MKVNVQLVSVVLQELVAHVRRGDASITDKDQFPPLVAEGHKSPQDLRKLFQESFDENGFDRGDDDQVVREVKTILEHASNTWHQGFMGKLYAATTPVCTHLK